MNVLNFQKEFGVQHQMKFTDQKQWCVYFLVKGHEIVYVGKSSIGGVWGRVKSHSKNKNFDSYFLYGSFQTENEALMIEGSFITLINPMYNKTGQKAKSYEISYLINWVTNKRIDAKKKANEESIQSNGNEFEVFMPIWIMLFSILMLLAMCVSEFIGVDVSFNFLLFVFLMSLPISVVIIKKLKKENRHASSNI